ncbi:MAG: glycolate oxidase iron-sulfur subunit [Gammaproteobacteria bacterium]|nr:MAG: glycolate oxidase iron-sulfur subunit [Gammaproteobacteria bacterium]
MQTNLADFIRDTPEGKRAEQILRNCVHCGFCTATCPTYQLLGDELDGPRGRIYQIKLFLEGETPSPHIRDHLDRCLVCRSCETTCPSGVDYHHLLDIGREALEERAPRSLPERLLRRAMVWLFSDPRHFAPLLGLARLVRPALPAALRNKVLPRRPLPAPAQPTPGGKGRRMLMLDGCVQPALAPQINRALSLLLDRLGIETLGVPQAGCCGALPQHLSDAQRAREIARRNIDAWLPELEAGAEALVVTASGCGAHVKDYPTLLAGDPDYAEAARQIAEKARDPVEILLAEDLRRLHLKPRAKRIAVHTPCSLQHGLGLGGRIQSLLTRLGYTLAETTEDHLCCGSAGTYSLTQPAIASRLRARKLQALRIDAPDLIVTANIGCLGHLQDEGGTPVAHWLNLLAEDLPPLPESSPATG